MLLHHWKYSCFVSFFFSVGVISLQNAEIPFDMSNGTKVYRLPFLAHTCFSTLDLFKNTVLKNYQEVWTVARIDEEITKGSGLAAHN